MPFPTFFGAKLAELRRCVCGKDYWFPGERWQHKGCVANTVVANEPVANKSRYKDQEARRVYMRDYMRARRARLPS